MKAAHINMQHNLTQELILYKFELDHNAAEATKNIRCAKREGTVDHITITRWFKKFYLSCKKDRANSSRGEKKILIQTPCSKPGRQIVLSIRQAKYITVQCGWSPSGPQQNHLKWPHCASHYQNTAKLYDLPEYYNQLRVPSMGQVGFRSKLCKKTHF